MLGTRSSWFKDLPKRWLLAVHQTNVTATRCASCLCRAWPYLMNAEETDGWQRHSSVRRFLGSECGAGRALRSPANS